MSLYKMPAYQKLNAYYQHNTIYNVLGIERNENRHSAFIAWILNPIESHSLGEIPMRKFLSLIATKAYHAKESMTEEVLRHLITGNYKIKSSTIKNEQSIIGLINSQRDKFPDIVKNGVWKDNAQNRFDIWMLLEITLNNSSDKEATWNIPLILENKIYSTEGYHDDSEKAQTVRYSKAMKIICKDLGLRDNCQPLMVYLTPAYSAEPKCKSFLHLTYQELLDHVISPASMLASSRNISDDAKILIDGYIRNLSCPAKNDNKKDYSILAIDEDENKYLEEIYESEAYQIALAKIHSNEAILLMGNKNKDNEDKDPPYQFIDDFWNANEDLFKIVLYNHFKNEKNKITIVNKIVKGSNRDNTRYFVFANNTVLNEKPASKSESSYLIFKAYCIQNHERDLTLEDLRSAFPVSINQYYCKKYFQHLFYNIDDSLSFDVKGRFDGKKVNLKDNPWDFYQDQAHEFPNVDKNIRSVKMWRKDDFDRLLEKARSLGIRIEASE